MKMLSSLAVSLSLFLLPIQGLLLTMIGFIVLDTVIGIYVTVRLNGWGSVQSTKFFNLVVKSFFYLFSVIMAFLVDKFVFDGRIMEVSFLLAKSMTCVWVFNEIKSCDENSMKLGNRSFFEIVKSLITTAKDLKKDLNEIKQ